MKLFFLVFAFPFLSLAAFFDKEGKYIDGPVTINSPQIGWTTMGIKPHFGGVLTLTNDGENYFCTGSLITSNLKEASSPVYILTNGHCTNYIREFLNNFSLIVIGKKGKSPYFGVPNNFKINRNMGKTLIKGLRIEYASIHRKDIAIISTELRVQDLVSENIPVYTFARELTKSVTNIGIPLARDEESLSLHKSDCQLSDKVLIKEGPFVSKAYRNNCSIVSGFSGSPLFNDKLEIVAIQSTSYKMKAKGNDCDLHKPCEIHEFRKESYKEWGYSHSVVGLKKCFNELGFFDRNLKKCPLR